MRANRFLLLLPALIQMSVINALGQWEHTGVPLAYPVTSLAFIGTNTFAGTSDGHVYLSTDNGTSWKSTDAELPGQWGAFVLAVNGTNIFAGNASGIFLSTDIGTTWKEVDSSLGASRPLTVVSLTATEGKLYAGLANGLYVTQITGQAGELLGYSVSRSMQLLLQGPISSQGRITACCSTQRTMVQVGHQSVECWRLPSLSVTLLFLQGV